MKIFYGVIVALFMFATGCGGMEGVPIEDQVRLPQVDLTAGVDLSLGCGDASGSREEGASFYDNTCPFELKPEFTVQQDQCSFIFKEATLKNRNVQGAIDQEENYHFEFLFGLSVYKCTGQLGAGNSLDATRGYDFECRLKKKSCSFKLDFVSDSQSENLINEE